MLNSTLLQQSEISKGNSCQGDVDRLIRIENTAFAVNFFFLKQNMKFPKDIPLMSCTLLFMYSSFLLFFQIIFLHFLLR